MGKVKKPCLDRCSPTSIDSIDGPHVLAFSDWAFVLGFNVLGSDEDTRFTKGDKFLPCNTPGAEPAPYLVIRGRLKRAVLRPGDGVLVERVRLYGEANIIPCKWHKGWWRSWNGDGLAYARPSVLHNAQLHGQRTCFWDEALILYAAASHCDSNLSAPKKYE